MENLSIYLILLLAGIILGGAAVGSLMAHSIRPTPPEYHYPYYPQQGGHAPAHSALAFLLLAGGFILLLLLGGRLHQGALPQAGGSTANMSLEAPLETFSPARREAAPGASRFYIQAGAYEMWDQAERAERALAARYPLPTGILHFKQMEAPYKAVAGPFGSYAEAVAKMEQYEIDGIILEYVK